MTSGTPRDTTAFEVREALHQAGCPICWLALRSVGRFIESVAYEQVNDVDLRRELRSARGFCNVHAFRWLREARNMVGTAIIYRDVIAAALRGLESGANDGHAERQRGLLRTILGQDEARHAPCPACRTQSEAETRYLGSLLTVLTTDASARTSFEHSAGLCLRHAEAVVRRGGSGAELVLAQARQRMNALLHDLDEVIRKEDHRFRHEVRTEAERIAPRRAVTWTAGSEGLVDRSRARQLRAR